MTSNFIVAYLFAVLPENSIIIKHLVGITSRVTIIEQYEDWYTLFDYWYT